MPAYLGGSDRVGIKWVAGYEQNRAKGLPYVYGVFVLTDAETGRPLALIDGGWITEMRTAGVSGVVMRHVPDQPERLAIVGAGVQGRRHLELLLEQRPGIEQVRVFDAVPDASRALLALAGDREGVVASDARDALEGADLVVTVVTGNSTASEWVFAASSRGSSGTVTTVTTRSAPSSASRASEATTPSRSPARASSARDASGTASKTLTCSMPGRCSSSSSRCRRPCTPAPTIASRSGWSGT